MTEQQAEALRSTAAALEDIADLVEQDLPSLDWTVYDEMIDETTETDTSFGRTWTDIKRCVESHLTLSSANETINPDDELDYLRLTGRHPNGEREMKFNLRYYREGSVLMRIGLPCRAQIVEARMNDSTRKKSRFNNQCVSGGDDENDDSVWEFAPNSSNSD